MGKRNSLIEWLLSDGPKTVIKCALLAAALAAILESLIAAISKQAFEDTPVPAGLVKISTGRGHYVLTEPWVAEFQHWIFIVLLASLAVVAIIVFAVFYAQNKFAASTGAKVKIPTFPSDAPPQP
jgi:hypothetical protein